MGVANQLVVRLHRQFVAQRLHPFVGLCSPSVVRNRSLSAVSQGGLAAVVRVSVVFDAVAAVEAKRRAFRRRSKGSFRLDEGRKPTHM